MGGVTDEASQSRFGCAALFECSLDLCQHRVERQPQSPDLRSLVGGFHPARQVAGRDRPGGLPDPFERSKPHPNQPPRQPRQREQDGEPHEALDREQVVERLRGLGQRDSHDERPLHGRRTLRVLEGRCRIDAISGLTPTGGRGCEQLVALYSGTGPDGKFRWKSRRWRRAVEGQAPEADDDAGAVTKCHVCAGGQTRAVVRATAGASTQ